MVEGSPHVNVPTSSSSSSSEYSAQGQVLHCNSWMKAAVLLKSRSFTANSETMVAVLLEMDRCGSFPLHFTPHSLFSTWTHLKSSEKIPGAPAWRWGEWIWLIGPSRLHQNSPQGLNISSIRYFDQIRDLEIPITLHPLHHQNDRKWVIKSIRFLFCSSRITCVCVCSNANPLHYYALRVPRKADR